jgi:hypothetical protein
MIEYEVGELQMWNALAVIINYVNELFNLIELKLHRVMLRILLKELDYQIISFKNWELLYKLRIFIYFTMF